MECNFDKQSDGSFDTSNGQISIKGTVAASCSLSNRTEALDILPSTQVSLKISVEGSPSKTALCFLTKPPSTDHDIEKEVGRRTGANAPDFRCAQVAGSEIWNSHIVRAHNERINPGEASKVINVEVGKLFCPTNARDQFRCNLASFLGDNRGIKGILVVQYSQDDFDSEVVISDMKILNPMDGDGVQEEEQAQRSLRRMASKRSEHRRLERLSSIQGQFQAGVNATYYLLKSCQYDSSSRPTPWTPSTIERFLGSEVIDQDDMGFDVLSQGPYYDKPFGVSTNPLEQVLLDDNTCGKFFQQ